MLAPCPISQPGAPSQLAVHDCLINIFTATLHTWIPFPANTTWSHMLWWQRDPLTTVLHQSKWIIFIAVFPWFWPLLWSSGQSSWLQIQRSGFDSQHYQIFWEVVDLERGPFSLVRTIEELLERKSSGSSLENRDYSCRGSAMLTMRHSSIRKSSSNFANKRRSLGRYSSLMDSGHSHYLFNNFHESKTWIELNTVMVINEVKKLAQLQFMVYKLTAT
jgi:hypothetical protein